MRHELHYNTTNVESMVVVVTPNNIEATRTITNIAIAKIVDVKETLFMVGPMEDIYLCSSAQVTEAHWLDNESYAFNEFVSKHTMIAKQQTPLVLSNKWVHLVKLTYNVPINKYTAGWNEKERQSLIYKLVHVMGFESNAWLGKCILYNVERRLWCYDQTFMHIPRL